MIGRWLASTDYLRLWQQCHRSIFIKLFTHWLLASESHSFRKAQNGEQQMTFHITGSRMLNKECPAPYGKCYKDKSEIILLYNAIIAIRCHSRLWLDKVCSTLMQRLLFCLTIGWDELINIHYIAELLTSAVKFRWIELSTMFHRMNYDYNDLSVSYQLSTQWSSTQWSLRWMDIRYWSSSHLRPIALFRMIYWIF